MRLVYAQIEPLLGKPAGKVADALHLVPIAAKTGLIGNTLELRQIVGEPTFLVGLPKEPCVGKAGTEHALVPGADNALGVFVRVDDGQELRCEFPVFFLDRKVFLMVPHDRDQDLIRQIQERRIEVPLNHRRILVEIGHKAAKVGILMDAAIPLLCESF